MALVQHGPDRGGDQNTNALKPIQRRFASSPIPRLLAVGYLTKGSEVREGGEKETEK